MQKTVHFCPKKSEVAIWHLNILKNSDCLIQNFEKSQQQH